MFSQAVRSRSEVIACGITPIDLRTPLGSLTTSKPLTRAWPELGVTSVVSIRINVDLPAPFGPSRPNTSPCLTLKFILSTAQNEPKYLLRSSISTSNTRRPSVQIGRDVRRHADREAAVAVVAAHADLERLDVALRAAHVALRRVVRVDAAKEDLAVAHAARRRAHLHLVADADLLDVRLLDVGADPEVVGVDQRDDRGAGIHDLARECGAHVDDAVDRCSDLGVAEPYL